MTQREYGKLVKELSPKSPIVKDRIWAFVVGGLICTVGQLFMNLYTYLGLEKTDAGTATSMSLTYVEEEQSKVVRVKSELVGYIVF